ncbi:MAG: PKD domain-containing protein [Polyangiales bacterium]
MKLQVAKVALLCAAIAPHAALAQESSTNANTCSISPSGGSSSGDITVAATAGQVGQTATLSNVSVTFPTTIANDPVIDAYNAGAFGLVPGLNPILTNVTVQVDATNTMEGSQPLFGSANVLVEIVDPNGDPGTGDEYLAPRDATIPLPNSNWSPTDLSIEFTQTVFIAMNGGITIDCVPSSSPIPFATLAVTTTPCDDTLDCNDPNGYCDFWGDCICNAGFGGADCACQDAVTCNGRGACNAAGNCVCDPGFGGPNCLCEDAIDCNSNGSCTAPGTCVCDPGFGGPDCSCDPAIACNGNGVCDASGACVCGPAWTGADCLTPTCIPETDCNGNGICVDGGCVCDAGFIGDDCSTQLCDPAVDCDGVPVAVGTIQPHIVATDAMGSLLSWSNQDFTLFNQPSPINLGLAAGLNPMSVQSGEGVVIVNDPGTDPASGTFDAIYRSNTAGVLDLTVQGNYVCPGIAFNCGPVLGDPMYPYWRANFVTTVATISGALVGSGAGQLPTELNGAPITYAIDGDVLCLSGAATDCDGTAYLNAFKGVGTDLSEPGSKRTVTIKQVFADPSDPSGQTLLPIHLDIIYDEVVSAGFTTAVSSSQEAGTISSDFSLAALGFGPVFFDITTTAEFTDDVTVCFEYPETMTDECDLRLLHNADGGADEFVDVTLGEAHEDCPFVDAETTCANNLCINTVTHQVCGGATSLSPWTPAMFVGNNAPSADAGLDQAVTVIGTVVHLDGSASYDLDGDPISYSWTLSGPAGSSATLQGATTATPSFVPDVYGDFVATLVVTDSGGLTGTDEVLVSFDNVPPVADATAHPQAVRVGEMVLLDGSGSTDANGDSLTYEWSVVLAPAGSVATLDDPTAQMPTFTPDIAGTYQMDLIVSDGIANSEVASVTVVATTAEGELVEALEAAIDVVNGLDPTTFKNKSLQKNMAKHIGQALAHVDNGKLNAARDKLEAVFQKTDGCANNASPDPNDWIDDCAAQSQVHPLIVQAIALIDEILGQ